MKGREEVADEERLGKNLDYLTKPIRGNMLYGA